VFSTVIHLAKKPGVHSTINLYFSIPGRYIGERCIRNTGALLLNDWTGGNWLIKNRVSNATNIFHLPTTQTTSGYIRRSTTTVTSLTLI